MDKPFSVTVFEGDVLTREIANAGATVSEAWRRGMRFLREECGALRHYTLSISGNGHTFSFPANVRPPWD